MKYIIYYFLIAVVFIAVGWFSKSFYDTVIPAIIPKTPRPTPLAKYSINNLSETNINPVKINIGQKIKSDPAYNVHEFHINFDPAVNSGNLKKVTGLINIPEGTGPFPIVVMYRGYVDKSIYYPGISTSRVSAELAKNGFITVAPDFLGYAGSDLEADNIFETRFQSYTTALTLLKSLNSVSSWDKKNIFIWGYSNGGQIALTMLEITKENYPTVLWAPVSKPFPYSILYFTDEASDSGKFLRHETSIFESDYNSDDFSLTNYFDWINAPIQLNQGTNDEAVPLAWSELLNKSLTSIGKDVEYITYPGTNHNMTPGWNEATLNMLKFYKKFVK